MCTRCFGSVSQSEAALGFVVSDDDDMNIFVVTGKESEDGGSVKQASKLGPRFRRTYTHRTEISVHGSRGGANVGEYGRTETSSDDKPVCFDCGLRGGSGEAASASGALAVRGNRRSIIHTLITIYCILAV